MALRPYTRYSMGCAGVWALILLAAKRRLDPVSWDRLRLTCAGWWMGWLSATIARVVYPPPRKLDPSAEKRLGIASLVLIALGLGSVVRLFVAGKPDRVGYWRRSER